MDPKRIWTYYRRAAKVIGAAEKTDGDAEKQAFFSVYPCFSDSPEGENVLVKAYLGDEAAMASLPWAEGEALAAELKPKVEDILSGTIHNPAQTEAILHALAAPVTIIQGPPGTGKTHTIVNLLKCIHALYPEVTRAREECPTAAG